MILRRFTAEPDKIQVLKQMQADFTDGDIADEYDKMKAELFQVMEPLICFQVENGYAYVLLTLGKKLDEKIAQLMEQEELLDSMLLSTIADAYLFEIDREFADRIRPYLAKEKAGVKARLEPGEHLPVEATKTIFEKLSGELSDITINDKYMFQPAKTMAYMLELTTDSTIFHAQHDCSTCKAVGCPMRKNRRERNRTFYSVDSYELESLAGSSSLEGVTYGVAIDIGTTTIVVQLVNIHNGTIYQTVSGLNHQREYGADVMLRVQSAIDGAGSHLREVVQKDILELLHCVAKKQNISMEEITELVISANVVMIHLLMGYDCDGLASYPFSSTHVFYEYHSFQSVFGSDETFAVCHFVPAFTPFVGGDIMAGIFATEMAQEDNTQLLVDLGTNGEMVLKHKNQYYVTSVAAGPAFEGGGIGCGTGSVEGAIYRFSLEKGVRRIRTICDKLSCGICGSGLVDILAELLKYGLLGTDGTLSRLYARKGYPVTADEKLKITQEDIRELQLAKGAIRVGIELLLKQAGLEREDVQIIYLAGGFGYHIQIDSALQLGIFPREWKEKIKAVGNTALGGAVYGLQHHEIFQEADRLRHNCKELVLANEPDFQTTYLQAMNFPVMTNLK